MRLCACYRVIIVIIKFMNDAAVSVEFFLFTVNGLSLTKQIYNDCN